MIDSMQKAMIALVSTTNDRLILSARPKESKCSQDYCIENLLPALNQVRTGNARLKGVSALRVHTDNSKYYTGAKITEKMSLKGLRRAPHPVHSPDVSPCDF
jgi:hypothetical protein